MAWLAPQVSTRSSRPGRSDAPEALFSVKPFISLCPPQANRQVCFPSYPTVGNQGRVPALERGSSRLKDSSRRGTTRTPRTLLSGALAGRAWVAPLHEALQRVELR